MMIMSDIRTRINELIKEFYNEMTVVDNSENTEIKLSAPAFDHNEAINAMRFMCLD